MRSRETTGFEIANVSAGRRGEWLVSTAGEVENSEPIAFADARAIGNNQMPGIEPGEAAEFGRNASRRRAQRSGWLANIDAAFAARSGDERQVTVRAP